MAAKPNSAANGTTVAEIANVELLDYEVNPCLSLNAKTYFRTNVPMSLSEGYQLADRLRALCDEIKERVEANPLLKDGYRARWPEDPLFAEVKPAPTRRPPPVAGPTVRRRPPSG